MPYKLNYRQVLNILLITKIYRYLFKIYENNNNISTI